MNAIAYCGLVCCVCSENKDLLVVRTEAVKSTAGVRIITVVKKKA